MRKIARVRAGNPLLRRLALNIIHDARVESQHYADEARAIGEFVQKKVRYVQDPRDVEHLTAPEDLVKQIQEGIAQGDCDDMSLLIASLLITIGHDPKFRCVRYSGKTGNYNHIYVVDYVRNGLSAPEERVVLDAILKDKPIGYEVPHASGDEYRTD